MERAATPNGKPISLDRSPNHCRGKKSAQQTMFVVTLDSRGECPRSCPPSSASSPPGAWRSSLARALSSRPPAFWGAQSQTNNTWPACGGCKTWRTGKGERREGDVRVSAAWISCSLPECASHKFLIEPRPIEENSLPVSKYMHSHTDVNLQTVQSSEFDVKRDLLKSGCCVSSPRIL